tara:strand:- start:1357 stop:2889 length:1533 start_codon:yes stop_codon:yes gene_type:complete
MENEIRKIVELEIDLDNIELDDMGVSCVSFVEEPAIEVDFMAFNREEFETYNDYPESAKNNAQRALDWAEENGWGTCGESTGKARANQLAKGENISEETIARMASFARHRQNKDTPYTEGCGKLMWDAWGGTSGIEWASSKLKKIREDMDADVSALTPYVDQLDEPIKKEAYIMSDEEQKIILDWAAEYGERITEEYTYLNLNENFEGVGDIAKVISGLDILGKLGVKQDEPAEIKYRYTGNLSSNSRNFCIALINQNKLYSRDDIDTLEAKLGTINPNMGPNGSSTYDLFKYKGSVNCKHHWNKVALYKPNGSRKVLMIDQGPAEGDAGEKMSDAPHGGHTQSWIRKHAMSKEFTFAIQDADKRIVAGALMIPNQFILRRDENGDPYYVFFSKDTVKRIQERFNKAGFQNVTDVDHDGNIKNDNILLEQWIVESREHDKSKFYGFGNLPIGTWFGVYKVNNDETWADIKSGKIKGFSIAGDFISKGTAVKNEAETTMSKIIAILNEIKN